MGLFFNTRRPRSFNHTPIYYDPKKEALEERIMRKKKELGMLDESEYKPQIKGSFIDGTSHLKRRRDRPEKSSANTNIKIGVILVVLILLFYWFYFR